ncbi:hypothetical protein M407DRAFT_231350 [Tulasnella calospora MUT 4182]|uniref:Jacalin-type lectin domain-containing protein n=1 Tax=Tulasnella calospora MUT 4182 TaxID=1051891 RepID=A0A0C3L2X1_9AGAM|nr:hypothetical protein M407DRAFT_231350 [Tulasnella calospora MUT 4182]
MFFQTTDNCIREARHDWNWQDTDFVQPNALSGTDMAHVHSSGARRVMFFFQDNEGYLCCRRAQYFNWQPVERLCKAALCTGIAATTWNGGRYEHNAGADTNDVRVYYQDESNSLCEYRGSFEGSWSYGGIVNAFHKPLGTLAAISYVENMVQLRLYVQEDKEIVEWCKTGDGPGSWFRGYFREPALPNTDIVAIKRDIPNGFLVNVLWAGPDQILHQRVLAPNFFWMDSTPIGYLDTAGTFLGSWNGNYFTDNDSNIDSKRIKKIKIRCGDIIDGIGLEFSDGSSTPWRGGQGGGYHEFVLFDGEDIVQMNVCSFNRQVSKMKFLTSTGRSSPYYGNHGGTAEVWSYEGNALAGFAGASDNFLNGIMAMWSERKSKVTLNTLEDLIVQSNVLGNEIQTASGLCQKYEDTSATLKNEIEVGLHGPADLAMQGISVLIQSVEKLYHSANDGLVTDALVALCKGHSVVVGTRFKDLHQQSSAIMNRLNDLVLDVTHEAATAQSRIKHVGEMLTIAATMRASAEETRQMRLGRIEDAKAHITKARQTREEAERNKRSNQTGRIIRDIFTLGLGEIGDLGGFNEAIDYADKLINSAENNLHASETGLAEATAGLNNIDAELQRFTSLKATLDGYGPTLTAQVTLTTGLRTKTMQLVNISLDISVFLGTLAAKTETLDLNSTAQKFAESILTIGTLIGTTVVIKGTLMERPEDMQKTLMLIANSPVAAVDLDDAM